MAIVDKLAKLIDPSNATLIITAIIVILGCYLLFGHYLHRYPPGPWGVPLLGCWPWMTHNWHKDFEKLGKGFGDIYTVWLLNTPVLVFQGWKAIDEAFNKQTNIFCQRPYSHGFASQGVTQGTMFKTRYNDTFKSRKKFLMANVKKFTFSSKDNTNRIQDEVDAIINIFKEKNQQPFLLAEAIRVHAANPIPIMFFGKSYDVNDKEFIAAQDNMGTWFTMMAEACEADVLPVLRFLPRRCVPAGKAAAAKLIDFFKQAIAECRENYDENNIRSFVDQCIKSDYDEEEILVHLLSYWGDSTDSVPGAIRLWMHLICTYPEAQIKMHEELDRVLGDRVPSLSDRLDLPYLEATILEALRMTSAVPISLPHETYADTEFMGYKIPKGTKYMINVSTAHKDPKVWKHPERFDPSRFITKEGKCNYKHDGWMAYGIGRRICIGEPLARQLMFVVAANLIQKFSFTFPADDVPPKDPLELACPGVTNMPRDFKIIAIPRDSV